MSEYRDVLGHHRDDLVPVLVLLKGRVRGDQRKLTSPDRFTELAIATTQHDVDVKVVLENFASVRRQIPIRTGAGAPLLGGDFLWVEFRKHLAERDRLQQPAHLVVFTEKVRS